MKNLIIILTTIFITTINIPAQGTEPPISGGVYQVSSKDHLLWIINNGSSWSADFEQTADISFDASDFEIGGDFHNDGKGFKMISNGLFNSFTGTYDGQNHSIDGLYINLSGVGGVGFFNSVDGGTISNLSLTNADILATGSSFNVGILAGSITNSTNINNCSTSGNVEGPDNVGGLIGYIRNSSSVTNSSSSATVIGWNYEVGGLVGDNNGCSITSSNASGTVSCNGATSRCGGLIGRSAGTGALISECYTTGTVSGNGGSIGGLIGENLTPSVVSKCYAASNVNSEASNTGGLIGVNNDGNISNCYSTGDVTKTGGLSNNFAAFCGVNANASIENCYSIGSVYYDGTSNPTDKGFANQGTGGTFANNYFDSEASNQSTATGATAKNTTAMKTNSTFTGAGWSTTIWYRDDGFNNGYPYLEWQNPSGTPLPVELTYFEGFYDNGSIILKWETATEVNNFGFDVEMDSENTGAWEKIGFVKGNGTTNSPKQYSFTHPVNFEENPSLLSYRLKQIDNDGTFTYSKVISIDISDITSIKNEVIYDFSLHQNFPNPFNPSTTIYYSIPKESHVELIVFDMLGRKIENLLSKNQSAGEHQIEFDGSNLNSGVYFCVMKADNFVSTIKLVLTK